MWPSRSRSTAAVGGRIWRSWLADRAMATFLCRFREPGGDGGAKLRWAWSDRYTRLLKDLHFLISAFAEGGNDGAGMSHAAAARCQ